MLHLLCTLTLVLRDHPTKLQPEATLFLDLFGSDWSPNLTAGTVDAPPKSPSADRYFLAAACPS